MLKQICSVIALSIALIACNDNPKTGAQPSHTPAPEEAIEKPQNALRHFRGALKGGMKGDSIFFDVSADGARLENLTFKGYWYCDGKLERQDIAGPEGHFPIVNGKVDGHISEPPNGGATAWRFDLSATIEGDKANGTFRMNINALSCNTGTLQFEATTD